MGLGMGRLVVLAAALAVTIGLSLVAAAGRSAAMGLCNCCETSLTPSCGKVCAGTTLTPGMCPAIVDYEGTGAAAKGSNPLNGMSLKDLSIGTPTAWQLELFRRFLEKGRRQAVATYKTALRHLRRGKISETELAKAKPLYDEALVNYYHGIRAYLNSVGTKSD
ncbi:hypothetical protein [Taklimakanibacter lacteus]|uniref:hypothetical protein n=1 Tax=Taklimakanibacter lacteus TaxID=2268456 RepID=UPI0013C46DCE